MISRRELLIAAAAATVLPGRASANSADKSGAHTAIDQESISWTTFQAQMTTLAAAEANSSIDLPTVAERGMLYLKQLDISSADFKDAVEMSYETGNRYWLWQRMIKERNINGGILNIDSDQLVQLHDHPGATGLVRIISGETEVWQFDLVTQGHKGEGAGKQDIAELVRVSHRILKPGDMAVLTPKKGNIHALRAVSQQCSMLDFFIPPYQRNQRNWYEPLTTTWFEQEKFACKKIPQDEFMKA